MKQIGYIFVLFVAIFFLTSCETPQDQNATRQNEQIQTTPSVALSTVYASSVMSGVYNQYSDLNISLVTFNVTNNEDSSVSLTFISEIQDYSSESKSTEIIPAHTTKIITQNPLIKPGIDIKEMVTANLYFKVVSSTGSIIDEKTVPIKLYAKDTMVWAAVENGELVDTSVLIAAWVTPHEKEIDELIRLSAENHPTKSIEGYQCSDCKTDDDWAKYTSLQVQAIYDTLKNNYKITYINAPIAYSGKEESSQRVKLPKEAINLASANCIDGTVLFASALESVGINPKLVITPGHAFLCWDVNEKGEMVDCLETTMIGNSDYIDANNKGLDEYREEVNNGNFNNGTSKVISIALLREVGIHSMN